MTLKTRFIISFFPHIILVIIEISLRKENILVKNKFVKDSPPDFDKIQKTLAAEWLERPKGERPNESVQSESEKGSNTTQ